MDRKPLLTGLLGCALLLGAASPALANGWVYTGPHGAVVQHWGPGPYHPCCGYSGGAVAAGAVAGLATGVAIGAAAHPAPPPQVYVAPAPVVVAPPPVVVAPPPRPVYAVPGAYYYVP